MFPLSCLKQKEKALSQGFSIFLTMRDKLLLSEMWWQVVLFYFSSKTEWEQCILMNCIKSPNWPGSGIKTRSKHDSLSYGICSKPHISFPPQRSLYKPVSEVGLCWRCSMARELCNKKAPWVKSFVLSNPYCPVWQLWSCTRWDGNFPPGIRDICSSDACASTEGAVPREDTVGIWF